MFKLYYLNIIKIESLIFLSAHRYLRLFKAIFVLFCSLFAQIVCYYIRWLLPQLFSRFSRFQNHLRSYDVVQCISYLLNNKKSLWLTSYLQRVWSNFKESFLYSTTFPLFWLKKQEPTNLIEIPAPRIVLN